MSQPNPSDLDMMYAAVKSDDKESLMDAVSHYKTADLICSPPAPHSPLPLTSDPLLLDVAAFYGAERCFRYLLSLSPDTSRVDSLGRALVHFAAFSGNVQIFELLDELSLSFAAKGVNDLSPFHIAAKYGHLGLCKWLYVRGCSTSEHSRDGHSPVRLAIENYHFDVADFLLRTGADVHEANETLIAGKTLLHHGIENLPRGIEIVAFLLARGARQIADARGTMPLHDACCRRNIELISMLIDHDAAINGLDRKLMTPLHYAVRHNSMPVCVFLLENDSDLGAVDRRGRTPLHHAAALGFLQLVELLCDYGADVLAIDWDEKTPMNLAYSHNRRQVVTYFASLGVKNHDDYEEEEEIDRRVQPRMSIRGEFPERKTYARF